MTAIEPCSCPQSLSLTAEVARLTARVLELEGELAWEKKMRGHALGALATVVGERKTLTARVAEVEAEREQLLRALERIFPAASEGVRNMSIPRRRDMYAARVVDAGTLVADLRSRAAGTPGSGGELGGGG